MRDFLPDVSVKTDVPVNEFLSRMYEVCRGFPQVAVRKSYTGNEDVPSISIEFLSVEQYRLENLRVLIFVWEWDDDRVWVELTSRSWIEDSPSYNEYVKSVQQFIKPFITAYNRKHQSRRRLHIPSLEQIVPKMSPNVRKVFADFVGSANKTFLNSRDWRNFYSFIRVCHSLKTKLDPEELRWFLLEAGFGEYYASELSSIYGHGRAILEKPRFPSAIPALLRKMPFKTG